MRMVYMSKEDKVRNFAIRAAQNFAKNSAMVTYTEGEVVPGCFLAVRWGYSRDCVVVFKLDKDFEPINYQQLVCRYGESDE